MNGYRLLAGALLLLTLSPASWSEEVAALLKPTKFDIVINGANAGQITAGTGTKVTVLKEDQDKVLVALNTSSNWVAKSDLEMPQPKTTPSPIPANTNAQVTQTQQSPSLAPSINNLGYKKSAQSSNSVAIEKDSSHNAASSTDLRVNIDGFAEHEYNRLQGQVILKNRGEYRVIEGPDTSLIQVFIFINSTDQPENVKSLILSKINDIVFPPKTWINYCYSVAHPRLKYLVVKSDPSTINKLISHIQEILPTEYPEKFIPIDGSQRVACQSIDILGDKKSEESFGRKSQNRSLFIFPLNSDGYNSSQYNDLTKQIKIIRENQLSQSTGPIVPTDTTPEKSESQRWLAYYYISTSSSPEDLKTRVLDKIRNISFPNESYIEYQYPTLHPNVMRIAIISNIKTILQFAPLIRDLLRSSAPPTFQHVAEEDSKDFKYTHFVILDKRSNKSSEKDEIILNQ
jgi:hypothetical protein